MSDLPLNVLGTTSPIPPWILDPASRWISVKEFAALYRRSVRRIQEMCHDGEISVFRVATYQDPTGRWWIRLPD